MAAHLSLKFSKFSLLFELFCKEIKDFTLFYVSKCFIYFVKQFLALSGGILWHKDRPKVECRK